MPKEVGTSNQAEGATNGSKALVTVAILMAIIAGVYAMVEPMNQRIDFLNEYLIKLEGKMIADDARETADIINFGSMSERFKEVETQFSALHREHELDINRMRAEEEALASRARELRNLQGLRAKDEHRAMMREDSLKIGIIDRRVSILEGIQPKLGNNGAGEWNRLFMDQDE